DHGTRGRGRGHRTPIQGARTTCNSADRQRRRDGPTRTCLRRFLEGAGISVRRVIANGGEVVVGGIVGCLSILPSSQRTQDQPCNLAWPKRWHCVPYLDGLLGTVAHEQVVIGKGLQPGSLAHRQAAALQRIGMDEVMTVLRNVAGYRS